MSELLCQIEEYWSRRAESFSCGQFSEGKIARWLPVLQRELPHEKSLRILDVGTGPGFFAVLLSGQGYQVTAIDYTQAMLDKAMENAGCLKNQISFYQMDAQHLDFDDEGFDAVVSRNLTWNLENPGQAYKEWYRVLKKGGMLLNFDSGWYEYLFDKEKAEGFQKDRDNVKAAGIYDGVAYSESAVMEEISRKLVFSRCCRPQADLQLLLEAGFSQISVNTEIWKEIWDDEEQLNYASTPCFMLKAKK